MPSNELENDSSFFSEPKVLPIEERKHSLEDYEKALDQAEIKDLTDKVFEKKPQINF
jgi:hypothetical protein